MSSRELIVLGTASQSPTRNRNHNGYVMRWDDRLILFDPGEGTQRQFTHAGVAAARLTDICITHFHGDHCLGVPGIIQRLSGDKVEREIPIYHPADGAHFLNRLRFASDYQPVTPIRPVPIDTDGEIGSIGQARLMARQLDHRVTTYGYRIQEPDRVRFDKEALVELGIAGPAVGQLRKHGALDVAGRRVHVEEVTETVAGQSMALVMDTRWCDGALELADNVDLLVCESTFLAPEQHLAAEYGHLTATEAARIAREAGAKHLVLTHFSARYQDNSLFVAEAQPIFDSVEAVEDFDRVTMPSPRRTSER